MSLKESQAKEALGWYELALSSALEPMDQALQASDQAGKALLARDVKGHLKAMALVLAALAQVNKALLENGRHMGPVLYAINGDQDAMSRFTNSSSQSLKSLEQAIGALKAFGQVSDPKETFTQYFHALSGAVSDLGRFQKTLKDMAQRPQDMLQFEQAVQEARGTNTAAWKAGQKAVAQGTGKSALTQASGIAS